MATRYGRTPETSDASGYLSDESDFYGNEDVKKELEQEAASFDVHEYWGNPPVSLVSIAEANLKSPVMEKAAMLYNPYEGVFSGRQLTETIEEFVERLPPQTTQGSLLDDWIWIANPFRKAQAAKESKSNITGEGPPDEASDLSQFVVRGNRLLEELTVIKNEIGKKSGVTKTAINRAITTEKDAIVQKILQTATELHCTAGKWMLFCDPAEVNTVWAIVARGTANNELGIASKVAPDDGDERKPRLICIYTKDFNDLDDVSRVVQKMRDLKLVETRQAIYYKCDAYTYLGISSNNPYGIKASLYSSSDMLKPREEKKEQKLEGFFYKKRKEPGGWRQLE